MPNFRRYYISNAFVFITCVTHDRIHYLEGERNIAVFWDTLRKVQALHPFHLFAYVTLPDHFHWLLQLPENKPNFSIILQSVKYNFTWNLKRDLGINKSLKVWQNRFWDHVIRDDDDLQIHFDYIHWNPVKHGYVKNPEDWSESTFNFWKDKGFYGENRNYKEPPTISNMHLE